MQTANNPALAAMKDIQPPEPIGAWPLAYGYWLLMAVIIVTIIACAFWLIKRHRHSAAKREAIAQLNRLDIHHKQLAIEVNALLKRSAMSYTPRENIASLDGDSWYAWLRQQDHKMDETLPKLLAKRYQAQALTTAEAKQLKIAAKQWLNNALPLEQNSTGKEVLCSQ